MYTFRTSNKTEHKEIKKLLTELRIITGRKTSAIILKALETYKKIIK